MHTNLLREMYDTLTQDIIIPQRKSCSNRVNIIKKLTSRAKSQSVNLLFSLLVVNPKFVHALYSLLHLHFVRP